MTCKEIINRLLKEDHITVNEAVLLLKSIDETILNREKKC